MIVDCLKQIVTFRGGHVSNAWLGFGLWGLYQNDFDEVAMNGTALVFTLQASQSRELDEVYVAEVELLQGNHSFAPSPSTPAKCSSEAVGSEFTDSARQYRLWYCVRPRTTDYPDDSVMFDAESHMYYPNISNEEAFGYSYAYGEGHFYEKTNHASRGTCGLFFTNQTSAALNEKQTIENSIDLLESELLQCVQEGAIIGETKGQKVIVNRTHIDLSAIFIDAASFMNYSGYDLSDIPPDMTSTTTGQPTPTDPSTSSEDSDIGNMLTCFEMIAVSNILSIVFYFYFYFYF